MTLLTAAPSENARWFDAHDDTHAAYRSADFLGSVQPTPIGTYVAFDSRGEPIGRFDTLDAARASLFTTPHPYNVSRMRRNHRLLAATAAASGVLAATLALTAAALAPVL
jgi:hypothetical protein